MRRATIAPTAAQLEAVDALESLIRHGGFLAAGIDAGSADEAALAFLDDNLGLYRLDSVDGLEVATVAPLGANGKVVVLRQTVGGLPVSPDGFASVGLVGSADAGRKVAYVSCSSARTRWHDMAVIGHEYGHMIENRMIGKGFRRQGSHAGAMGESSGDLLGMEYLNEYRFVPTNGENKHARRLRDRQPAQGDP